MMKKSNTLKRLLKTLINYYKPLIIVVFICIIISAVASLGSSIFIKTLIDDIIEPGIKYGFDSVKDDLLKLSIIMGIIYLVGILASFIYNRLMAIITQGFLAKLRLDMFNHMETLPIRYFDTHQHGDIMSCYTNDIDALRQMISQSLPQILLSLFTVLTSLIIMLSYSIWLTLIVLLFVVVMFRVTKVFGGRSAKYFIAQQKSIGQLEGFVEEMIEGQKVIKTFCHEEDSKRDFNVINEKLYSDAKNANAAANMLMPIMGNLGNLLYVVLAIIGVVFISFNVNNISFRGIGLLEIGVAVTFLGMSKQFTQNIAQTSQQINSVAMALAGAKRIFELLDEEPEFDDGYVTLVNVRKNEFGELVESNERTGLWAWKHPHKATNSVTYTELKGDIRLFDVDFGYNPNKIVLHNVTIYAKPGQKIAFVGATGAGKTTITNLLNRFYDIADGKIRFDGININKINKKDLRRSIGIVLQDTNLFTGTVRDNIRYGKLDATDEEIIEAAKIANAHDFITRLPNGYDTMLTANGANLSQGQRQLLSIARAAVANAPVMILDEATSSIDTRTELLVQRGTDELMKGRTVFVIAHRLSTVKNSNAIMVLEKGHIIERGDHEDLINQHGTYYQLYTGGFELE